MPRDGNGAYTLPHDFVADKVADINPSAERIQEQFDDIAVQLNDVETTGTIAAQLALKADSADVDAALLLKADAADLDGKVDVTAVGVSIATLTGGKLTASQIPDSITSPFRYRGTWDANTNTTHPVGGGATGSLADGVGTEGDVWKVVTAGITSLDGVAVWNVGDELYFGGGTWNQLGLSGETTIAATTFTAYSVAYKNTNINAVRSDPSKAWQPDGVDVPDGETVLLTGNTNQAQNGLWVFNDAANNLTRPTGYANGDVITPPLTVYVTTGDQYGETTIGLDTNDTVIVGTTPTSWLPTTFGVGTLASGSVVAGGYDGQKIPTLGTPRRLHPSDIDPPRRFTTGVTLWEPFKPYLNLIRVGRLSSLMVENSKWSRTSALTLLLQRHNTIEIDEPCYVNAQVPGGDLTSKEVIFHANCPIIQNNPGLSVFDLSGEYNVTFTGVLNIIYPTRSSASVKAIKSTTTLTNFSADRIYTQGVDYAFYASGAVSGIDIRSIGVSNTTLDTAFYVSETTTGLSTIQPVRVSTLPYYTAVTWAFNTTYYPRIMSPVIELTGAQTANKVITLSMRNGIEGTRARFIHSMTGGFTWDVGGKKTISNGQQAEVEIRNGAWALIA